jgi:AcrR family transcriptional regulator
VTQTTVEHIAKAARVAKGTVYLYYGSKDEILRQLLEEDLEELRTSALAAIHESGKPEARLRGYITAILAFFDKHRDFIDHCQLELTPDVRRKVRTVLSQCYKDQVDAWDSVLRQAVATGTVVAANVDGAGSNIVSLARGLALHRLAGWPAGPIAPIATRAGRLLWKGLAGR